MREPEPATVERHASPAPAATRPIATPEPERIYEYVEPAPVDVVILVSTQEEADHILRHHRVESTLRSLTGEPARSISVLVIDPGDDQAAALRMLDDQLQAMRADGGRQFSVVDLRHSAAASEN